MKNQTQASIPAFSSGFALHRLNTIVVSRDIGVELHHLQPGQLHRTAGGPAAATFGNFKMTGQPAWCTIKRVSGHGFKRLVLTLLMPPKNFDWSCQDTL